MTTILIQDTFTDRDGVDLESHTPDVDTSGKGWTLTDLTGLPPFPKDFVVRNNRLDVSGSGGGAVVNVGQFNVVLEFDWIPSSKNNRISVIARHRDEKNRNYIQMRAPHRDIRLASVVEGAVKTFKSESFTWQYGRLYRIRVVVFRTLYRVYVDNVLAYSAFNEDNELNTSYGILVRRVSTPQIFDNFLITDVPSIMEISSSEAFESDNAIRKSFPKRIGVSKS